MTRRQRKPLPLLFIAYFTADSPYVQEAAKLQESLDNLKLVFEIAEYADRGGWAANAGIAPEFIRQMLIETYGEHDRLVYLDADSVVCRYPALIDHLREADIGVCQHDGVWRYSTLFLQRSARVLGLLDRWKALCGRDLKGVDPVGRHFNTAVRGTPDLVIHELSAEYAYGGETLQVGGGEPVIEHRHLSRIVREGVEA